MNSDQIRKRAQALDEAIEKRDVGATLGFFSEDRTIGMFGLTLKESHRLDVRSSSGDQPHPGDHHDRWIHLELGEVFASNFAERALMKFLGRVSVKSL
jgi:hypothetical protein